MQDFLPDQRTEIYLIRHGETTLSATGQYIGSSEIPLSEHGRQQVRLLAEQLREIHFDVCYCSSMGRCQETARILATPHGLLRTPVPELREIDYGDWEQLTSTEMQARDPELYAAWTQDPAQVRAPQGESGDDVLRRVRPAMERIASDHLGQRVLLVAHRTVNRIWLCHVLGYPIASYRQAVGQDLTAVNRVEYGPGAETADSETGYRFVVKRMNDTRHLQR